MEWLTQNWLTLLLIVGVIAFMRFGGMGCGMGGRRAEPGHRHVPQSGADEPVAAAPATDPVTQHPVDPASAVSTVYKGQAYYFESRENRDRFEAAPDQFATAPSNNPKGKHGHGGGCC